MGDSPAADVVADPARDWYGISEAAGRLGVSRQSLHQRVTRLQGAQKVGNRWRIPAQTVEALAMAERAKAVASGSVRALPGVMEAQAARVGDVEELVQRVADLEAAVADQGSRFELELRNRDDVIAELRMEKRQLRRALSAFMQGLAHLVDEEVDTSTGPGRGNGDG